MSVIVFVSLTPLDKGESVGRYVARAVDVIDRSGLAYQLTPMGTIIEGPDWDTVMRVVGDAFQVMAKECRRISFVIKGDYRSGRTGGLETKVNSIERHLGRPLHKGGGSTSE